jgi:hypothetical protein
MPLTERETRDIGQDITCGNLTVRDGLSASFAPGTMFSADVKIQGPGPGPGPSLVVTDGVSGAQASAAGTVLELESSGAVILTLRGLQKAIAFANALGALDGAVTYDAVARTMEFRTGGNITRVIITDTGLFHAQGDCRLGDADADVLGFYSVAGVARPTVVGSRATGAALVSLLGALQAMGLIIDGTVA